MALSSRPSFQPIVLLAVGMACAHGGTSGPPGSRTTEQLDVVPGFLAAWQEVRTAPREEQLGRARQALLAGHPELFGAEVFGPGATLDRDLERLLVEMPRLEPKLRALSERMPGEVDRSTRRFLEQFPELGWSGPVALSLSFSHFESVWRTVDARKTLVLGIDAIAFYRGPYAPVEPLVHHALAAALLPGWTGPGPAPTWWTLWEEAFPLVAVRTIDPEATDADLRLTPEGKDPAYLGALAHRVRGVLDSTKEADRKMVTGSAGASAAGARSLALRVGQRILTGRTLHDAARLQGAQLRSAVDAALISIERPGS